MSPKKTIVIYVSHGILTPADFSTPTLISHSIRNNLIGPQTPCGEYALTKQKVKVVPKTTANKSN
jgi:hypothetical protein